MGALLRLRSRASLLTFTALAGVALSALSPACERYEAPPTVTIDGLSGGLLYDSKAPLGLSFGQPVDISTFNFKVAYDDLDIEGNLPDEDDDPDTELRVLVSHDPTDGDQGGHLQVDPDTSGAQFVLDAALPVGPELVVLVEPGLTGTGGRTRRIRTNIPFSYTVRCNGTRATQLKSGVYFVLLDVVEPLGTQIQLYGAIDVDPATGAFVAQFTNADRNLDGSRCPGGCSDVDRCRLLPGPASCVPPSTKAGTSAEYSDFVPNADPPTGYSFPVEGCAIDNGAGAGVVTAPATMVVISPPVTVEGLTMTAFFGPDAKGVVSATGSLTADTVLLGGNVVGDGKGKGSMTATYIPDAQLPMGVPQPTKKASSADAGANGGTDAGL
jgi:hypothetical protein